MSFQNTEQLFFGRSLKVRIELEDVQPQDNFRLKAKRCGDIGGLWEVLLITFEFIPVISLSNCIPATRASVRCTALCVRHLIGLRLFRRSVRRMR